MGNHPVSKTCRRIVAAPRMLSAVQSPGVLQEFRPLLWSVTKTRSSSRNMSRPEVYHHKSRSCSPRIPHHRFPTPSHRKFAYIPSPGCEWPKVVSAPHRTPNSVIRPPGRQALTGESCSVSSVLHTPDNGQSSAAGPCYCQRIPRKRNFQSLSPIPFECPEDDEDAECADSPLRRKLISTVSGASANDRDTKKFRFLGKGTFGRVAFARFKGARVAAKVTTAPECRHIGEQNAKELLHPNIVRTLVVYPYPVRRLVIMEFGGERNLQQILDDPEEPISKIRRNFFAVQIARGLRHCHRCNVVHLDVKPSNVLVSRGHTCRLCDFGCSLRLAPNDPCACKGATFWKTWVPGTVAYVAPELFQGEVPSFKADIYSFGVMLWQMLTRRIPYESEEPHAIIYKVVSKGLRPRFPVWADAIYARIAMSCWEEAPCNRPSSEMLVCVFGSGSSADCQMIRHSN